MEEVWVGSQAVSRNSEYYLTNAELVEPACLLSNKCSAEAFCHAVNGMQR